MMIDSYSWYNQQKAPKGNKSHDQQNVIPIIHFNDSDTTLKLWEFNIWLKVEKLIFFHVNRWKRVHEEGKSIISLVHIMLQVNVTFSLKFCNLGCFSNSFVTPCIVSFWQLPDDCFSWSMKLWVASTCFWRSSSLRIYIHIYVY